MQYISLECKYLSLNLRPIERAPFCVTHQRQAMDVK